MNRLHEANGMLEGNYYDFRHDESFTYDKQGNISSLIRWDDCDFMNYLPITYDGNHSSADAILAHEIGHAENNMNGTSVKYNREEAKKSNGSIIEKRKGNLNEEKSIFYENQVRQQEGEPERSYDYYKANKDQ